MESSQLTWEEAEYAMNKGIERWCNAEKDKRSNYEPGRGNQGIESHATGAVGECAFAKYLNIPWKPETKKRDIHRGDVANFQVKTITHQDHCMLVKRHDDPKFPFVLVYVTFRPSNVYAVFYGWMWGYDAKVPKYWDETRFNRPTYAIPKTALNLMSSLPPVEMQEALL